MAVWSTIQNGNLEGDLRIDPEYYQPQYLDNEAALDRKEAVSLEDILSDVRYGIYTEPHYLREGVNFLRALNLKEYGIEGEVLKVDKDVISSDKYLLKVGEVLIVRSGANVGDTGIIMEDLKGATFGSYTIKMTFKEVNPFFAYAFFKSKFGRLQTVRFRTGLAQPNINIPNIKRIKIVKTISPAKQVEVEELVRESHGRVMESESLYAQAQQKLLDELGIKDLKLSHELSYSTEAEDAIKFDRIDAEYYQPKYDRLIDVIKKSKYGHSILKDKVSFVTAKFNPLKDPDKTFRYIELADINEAVGTVDSFSEIIGQNLPSRARMLLKPGDVIVSSVEGSLNKVALIEKEFGGSLGSTGFFVLRTKELLSGYLLVLMKSLLMQGQLARETSGTILTAVPKTSVQRLIMPNLPMEGQKRIDELLRKSHQARQEAKKLLDEAKRKVEQLIES